MLESNSRSFIPSPWLTELHDRANELGYYLDVQPTGPQYRAICGDLEDLEETLLGHGEEQVVTDRHIADSHSRTKTDDSPDRAALAAFMRWHTLKIERDRERPY